MTVYIRRVAVTRLFLSWLLLSLTIGGIDFYLEIRNADHLFRALAMKETASLSGETLPLDIRGSAERDALLRKAKGILKGRYVVVQVYDRDKKQILAQNAAGAEVVPEELMQNPSPLALAQSPAYTRLFVDGNMYVRVLFPLHGTNGDIVGYFAGVYQADTERVQQVIRGGVRTLCLIALVALLATLVFYQIIIFLHRELVGFAARLLRGNLELMEMLGAAIAQRDSDTSMHNYRVTIYAIRLAEAIHLKSSRIRNLIAGAFVHDVGKIGISDNILLKPGELTEHELAVMHTHVLLGVEIIKKSPAILEMADDVVEFHHERFDGSGYMRGLKGKDIPLNARIFAIADVFDALTSKRPYKEAFPFDVAMRILHEGRGRLFEPSLLDAFDKIVGDVYAQLKAASEAEVQSRLKSLAVKHFFSASSLAQFMKRQMHNAILTEPEEELARFVSGAPTPDHSRTS